MEKIIDKISSYQLLNNLIPGIGFLAAIQTFALVSITFEVWQMIFLGYFAGLAIGRVGSLLFEPMCVWCKLVRKRNDNYERYVFAEKQDNKIGILVEMQNMYRSFAAVSFVFGLLVVRQMIIESTFIEYTELVIISVIVLMLFLFGYVKQSKYVSARVDVAWNSKNNSKVTE